MGTPVQQSPLASFTNASDRTDITTFFNELSSLVGHILKFSVLIIDKDMNTQITNVAYTTCLVAMVNILKNFLSRTGCIPKL